MTRRERPSYGEEINETEEKCPVGHLDIEDLYRRLQMLDDAPISDYDITNTKYDTALSELFSANGISPRVRTQIDCSSGDATYLSSIKRDKPNRHGAKHRGETETKVKDYPTAVALLKKRLKAEADAIYQKQRLSSVPPVEIVREMFKYRASSIIRVEHAQKILPVKVTLDSPKKIKRLVADGPRSFAFKNIPIAPKGDKLNAWLEFEGSPLGVELAAHALGVSKDLAFSRTKGLSHLSEGGFIRLLRLRAEGVRLF